MSKKPKSLSIADQHALAAFFALHHGALALNDVPPKDIERVVGATFGLVEKRGSYRLTPRGKRAVKLAQTDF